MWVVEWSERDSLGRPVTEHRWLPETPGAAAGAAAGAVAVVEAEAGAAVVDSLLLTQAAAEIEADSAGAEGAAVAPVPDGTGLAVG